MMSLASLEQQAVERLAVDSSSPNPADRAMRG